MSGVHWHLLLNHAPLFGAIGGFGLLVFGMVLKLRVLEKAGLVVMILSALITIPVFLTGGDAVQAIRDSPDFSRTFTKLHRANAKISFWLMLVTGAVALISLFSRGFGKAGNVIRWLAVLLTLATVILMSITAWYGGKAAHQEIRNEKVLDVLPGS